MNKASLLSRLLFVFLCSSAILTTGCLKQLNNGLTLIEAKKSYAEGNSTRAFHLSEILANQGDTEAQYAVCYMHYYGVGVPQNKPLGVAWIKQAKENGNESACLAYEKLSQAGLAQS